MTGAPAAILAAPSCAPPPSLRSAAAVFAAAGALERAGRSILHLEVGEPDFPTPSHIVEAAVVAMRAGHTRYAPPAGLMELRVSVAEHVAARGVSVGPERVVVSPGAKLLLGCVLRSALAPGDEILVPDPGYPTYAVAASGAGARPAPYPVGPDGAVSAAAVAALVTPRTRAIVLNSPHNPTGGMLDRPTLGALAALVERHRLLLVSDEIYARLAFDRAHESIVALPGMAERAVLIDGFSKTYAMTGWRLAFGVLPAPLVAPVTALLGETASCTPPFVQMAGVAALTGPTDELAARVAELRRRRDALVAALAGPGAGGLACAAPAGGLYAFPRISGPAGGDAEAGERLARLLLHEEGIACVPGVAFGARGAGHLRIALTAPPASLRRAGQAVRRHAAAVR